MKNKYLKSPSVLQAPLRKAAMVLMATVLCPTLALAQYTVKPIIPPDAPDGKIVQAFGLNNAGKITGNVDDEDGGYSFVYDSKKGSYSRLEQGFSALDISNSGTIVGSVGITSQDSEGEIVDIGSKCAIRDKKGDVKTFVPPAFGDDLPFCQARGVNSSGKVSGFLRNENFSSWLGFVYDPKREAFEEFLPSPRTFAQGINARGEIAGSVDLSEIGSKPDRYGYLRYKDGAVKYFEVILAVPGRTEARGLSDSGLVAGFYVDYPTGEFRSFVTKLTAGTDFESVTLSENEIIDQKPCNPDFGLAPEPVAEGESYRLVTNYFVAQVRNDGVAVGSCDDSYLHSYLDEEEEVSKVVGRRYYGFMATPVK